MERVNIAILLYVVTGFLIEICLLFLTAGRAQTRW